MENITQELQRMRVVKNDQDLVEASPYDIQLLGCCLAMIHANRITGYDQLVVYWRRLRFYGFPLDEKHQIARIDRYRVARLLRMKGYEVDVYPNGTNELFSVKISSNSEPVYNDIDVLKICKLCGR